MLRVEQDKRETINMPKKIQEPTSVSYRMNLTPHSRRVLEAIKKREMQRTGRMVSGSLAAEVALRDYQARHDVIGNSK